MYFMTRTTVELKDEHRAILRAIAINRGWRGFSRAVEEAIDFYIEHHAESEVARRRLLVRSGAWSADEAYAYLKQQRGSHLDPRLVDAFLEVRQDTLRIKRELSDSLNPVPDPLPN